jgi:uncharacterized protein with HEPN domain
MSRDPRLFLQDILDAAAKVLAYTEGLSQEAFEDHSMTVDAVLRNLEIIGEAAKRIPPEIRQLAPLIPWRMICGFRDHLAHGYFGLDGDVVWEVASEEVPALVREMTRLVSMVDL